MDHRQSERAEQLRRVTAARTVGSVPDESALPLPPYHMRNTSKIYMLCRFDAEQVARIVPPGLTASGTGWGVISQYSVPSGWGLAPYSATYLAVELEGLPSNDGSPGLYMYAGWYSGIASRVMGGLYNGNVGAGWTSMHTVGDDIRFEGGPGDSAGLRLSARRSGQPRSMNGTTRFIGRRPGAPGFNSYSVAWSSDVYDTVEPCIDYLEGLPPSIARLEPLEFAWTAYLPNLSMAFTPPRPIGEAQQFSELDMQVVSMVGLFSHFGRAAAITNRDGVVLSLNSAAEGLVAEGHIRVVGGRLAAGHAGGPSIERLLGTLDGVSITERRLIEGTPPILAQAMLLSPDIAGPGRVLVVFDEPTGGAVADVGPALELLGLTPAEARIAALVGGGESPREAADALGVTYNTVRSSLKLVFDKLGVGRQSELARVVARLAG
ncbi:hypothetical protein [Devosia sp.]|uniref:hypothetical protein n=1 Tax=Devosia sp. TaxID=1871048 RepID=UPI0035B19DF9